jgi:hypothetical protein
MHHLETRRSGAHVPIDADRHAGTKLRLLLPGKVEEAQRDLAGSVTEAHQETAASAIDGFGEQNLATRQAAHPGRQHAQSKKLGAVLVAQGQEEQEILDAMYVEPFEFFG